MCRHVEGGQVKAARSGLTPLEQVIGQEADIGLDPGCGARAGFLGRGSPALAGKAAASISMAATAPQARVRSRLQPAKPVNIMARP